MKYISLLLLAATCSWAACSTDNKTNTNDSATVKATEPSHALVSWKDKNVENEKGRQQILDAVRADVKQKGYPEFQFVVNHLMVRDEFAFFKGDAKNADGSTYKTTGEMEDCCHVEALLKKENNTWTILSANAFSTDVWYSCLWKQYKAPKEIFDYAEDCVQ